MAPSYSYTQLYDNHKMCILLLLLFDAERIWKTISEDGNNCEIQDQLEKVVEETSEEMMLAYERVGLQNNRNNI